MRSQIRSRPFPLQKCNQFGFCGSGGGNGSSHCTGAASRERVGAKGEEKRRRARRGANKGTSIHERKGRASPLHPEILKEGRGRQERQPKSTVIYSDLWYHKPFSPLPHFKALLLRKKVDLEIFERGGGTTISPKELFAQTENT